MSEVEKRPREDEEAAVGEAKKAKAEPLFAASDVAAGPEPLAPAQADAVAKLLAFYFGDANLRRDKFLRQEQSRTPEGWCHISVLLTFNRLKSITTEAAHVVSAARGAAHGLSALLVVSEDGGMLRRAVPVRDDVDTEPRTLFVEGFTAAAAEPSVEAIVGAFAPFGEILIVRKRRGAEAHSAPRAARDQPKRFLGSAFIEFRDAASVAAAVAAAAASGGVAFSADPKGGAEDGAAGGGAEGVLLQVKPLATWLEENKQARESVNQRRKASVGDEAAAGGGGEGASAAGESGAVPEPVYDKGKILKLSGIPTPVRSTLEREAKDALNSSCALRAGQYPPARRRPSPDETNQKIAVHS